MGIYAEIRYNFGSKIDMPIANKNILSLTRDRNETYIANIEDSPYILSLRIDKVNLIKKLNETVKDTINKFVYSEW